MLKPYFETKLGTLYHGDCLETMPQLESVDVLLTDPPYGIGLGSTKGSGEGHGLRLDSYDGYLDTYENFIELIVPRLSFAIRKSKRSAIFTGPHIHEQKKTGRHRRYSLSCW